MPSEELVKAQLIVRQKMAVVIRFLKHLSPLIEAGFKEKALKERKSAHNIATSRNILNAPQATIRRSQWITVKRIAEGELLQAIDAQAKLPGN